jgi:hypothetical protein
VDYEFEMQFANPSLYLDLPPVLTMLMLTSLRLFGICHCHYFISYLFIDSRTTVNKGGEGGGREIKILQCQEGKQMEILLPARKHFLVAFL